MGALSQGQFQTTPWEWYAVGLYHVFYIHAGSDHRRSFSGWLGILGVWSRSSNRVLRFCLHDRPSVRQNIPAFPAESGHAALCGTQVQSLPAQPVLFPSLFASYSRNGFIRNCSEMDNWNTQMTNRRNIFSRFFRLLVMLHKFPTRISRNGTIKGSERHLLPEYTSWASSRNSSCWPAHFWRQGDKTGMYIW